MIDKNRNDYFHTLVSTSVYQCAIKGSNGETGSVILKNRTHAFHTLNAHQVLTVILILCCCWNVAQGIIDALLAHMLELREFGACLSLGEGI